MTGQAGPPPGGPWTNPRAPGSPRAEPTATTVAEPTGAGWRGAEPELIIAAILVIAFGSAGYALAGTAGAAVVALAAAALTLVVIRSLALPDPAPATVAVDAVSRGAGTLWSLTGYLRRRAGLTAGISSMTSYDAGLRKTLEHLLAARLAERHGVSLYLDPDGARRLLCGNDNGRDADLWYWIDPAREAARAQARAYGAADGGTDRQPGIPPRTLARLIDRLEKL